jgi:Dyp-type peroxidase family
MAKTELILSPGRALDLTQSNIDPESPIFGVMLKDLQANILKAHGRKFAYHIFLRLDPAKSVVTKKWIAEFAETRITSAWKLEHGRRAFKAAGIDGGTVFTLSISATGYRALGFQDSQFPKEQETPANSIVQDQPPGVDPTKVKDISAFRDGAKVRATKLGDVQADWEEPFRKDLDVLIIVADDQPDKALQLANGIIAEVSAFCTVPLNQKGHVLHRKVALTESYSGILNIEHFGYADGVSQPLFYKDDIEAQASTQNWNDAEPLNLVLVPDPHGRDYNSFGSFLVFRKLEQNVDGFMSAEKAMSPIKDGDGIVNKDLPGAMMVGRFRNGNPLVTSGGFTGNIRKESQILNDFDYSNDAPPPPSSVPQYGSKCPFFAHTRITNPREDIIVVPPTFTHSVRLTRRAIPYQDVSRFGPGNEDLVTPTDEELSKYQPAQDVGLLFMCYQAHIGKQFEFIQNNWANHGHIAGRNIGPDGVIGQISPLPPGLPFKPATPDLMPRKLPDQWGCPVTAAKPEITFGGFVKNKGGEYFFTPSISFLQMLALS